MDERGYFMRTYDERAFTDLQLNDHWSQENQALSTHKGVVRGLHFQRPPNAEVKLVRVVQGAIMDAFVDLRRGSPTYGQWDSIELSQENWKAVYLPKGFAHGYCTLSETSLVLYKVDMPYAPNAEGGIRWDDPGLAIRWPVSDPIVSIKDNSLPLLRDFITPFV